MSEFLGDIGLILMGLVLGIICVPILSGFLVALMVGATGGLFFGISSLVAVTIWVVLCLVWWL